MPEKKWQTHPRAPADLLSGAFSSPPLLRQLLFNRGVRRPEDMEIFLAADERLLHDPFLLPDVEIAVARIIRAVSQGELIAIYGDFDVDGITATAVLAQGLQAKGATVIPYIPSRFDEGYGLHLPALEQLRRQGASLVITVDCGINAHHEAQGAQRLGLDLIITDHHALPPALPPALATVHPARPDSRYPFPNLAAAGIAFKLIQALNEAMDTQEPLDGYLDLVALGTVADMAPLLGENRYLVKRGLEVMSGSARPGIEALKRCAQMERPRLTTEDISFVLAPRLNAAGRLDHGNLSYQLLTTASAQEAQALAETLESTNTTRQLLTSDLTQRARQEVLAGDAQAPLILVAGEDYHPGVVGLVAQRLAEEFYRPAVVVERGPQSSRGSARSIPEFHITDALRECHDLFTRYGGHAQAAGFTLATNRLDELQRRLVEIAARKLQGLDLRPTLNIDAELRLAVVRGNTFKELEALAPFGMGNPAPTFLSRSVAVAEWRTMAANGEHLRLKLKDGRGATWHAVGFGMGARAAALGPQVDVVYTLGVDHWSGQAMLELRLLDLGPSPL